MKPTIITISREYGSGGREIGTKLAEKLGIPFYDKTLIKLASEKSGLSEQSIQDSEDHLTNSMLFNLAIGNYAQNFYQEALPVMDQAYIAQFQTVKDVAEKGSCVIIGRCADYVLRDYEGCINVFIHAPMEYRIRRAMREYNIPEKNAAKHIQKMDKARASYYNHYTDQKWGDIKNYDLVINSIVGDETAVSLIELLAKSLTHNVS